MTVTYSGRVANARLCAFSRMLFYWRGSIYKLVYKEMLIFITLYSIASLVYRFMLTEPQRRIFEHIVLHCQTFTNLIPLSFVLGFYVAIVVTRWWNQFMNIPWPDKAMMYVTTLVEGADERSRLIRRTIMRYLTLASLLVFQATSVSVKKRFPTEDHLIEAGVMTLSDKKHLDNVQTPHGKWWVPFVWCFNIIKQARVEGMITDNFLLKTVMEEILHYRTLLGTLYSYDWISIPLVYTQVTTLAVYAFFTGCIMGRQFLDPSQGYPGHDVDLIVPIFTILQFFFYMGWLKVAEQMINPFGEDDDDFDMNWIIDRNMQISLLTVDNLYMSHPLLERDIYWEEHPPECLPYTKSAIGSLREPFMGSTADVSVSSEGMQIVNTMETINEESQQEAPFDAQLHANPLYNSPLASPCRTPRPTHKLLTNLYTQASSSKLTLGSMHGIDKHYQYTPTTSKLNLHNLEKPLLQTLHGASVRPSHTYIESWLDASNSRACSKLDLADSEDHGASRPCAGPSTGTYRHSVDLGSTVAAVQARLQQSIYDINDQPPAYTAEMAAANPILNSAEPVAAVEMHAPENGDTVLEMPPTDSDVCPANMPTVTIRGSNGSLHEYVASDASNSTVNSMAPLLKDFQDQSVEP